MQKNSVIIKGLSGVIVLVALVLIGFGINQVMRESVAKRFLNMYYTVGTESDANLLIRLYDAYSSSKNPEEVETIYDEVYDLIEQTYSAILAQGSYERALMDRSLLSTDNWAYHNEAVLWCEHIEVSRSDRYWKPGQLYDYTATVMVQRNGSSAFGTTQ